MDANRHNRLYSILLTLYAFGLVLSIGSMQFVKSMQTAQAAEANPGTSHVFTYVQYISGCIAGFACATLLLRHTKPALGRIFTKALNILLLVGFPLGTALGIYGLIKVDRETSTECEERASNKPLQPPGSAHG